MTAAPARERARDALVVALAPLTRTLQRERPRVRVVALHDLSGAAERAFVEKARWLTRTCSVVSLSAAHDRAGLDPERVNVVLTFDDGLREHHAFVAPVLRELGLPATFFVPSGALDLDGDDADRFSAQGLRRSRRFRFLTSAEVAELAREPLFEVGGHTASHADLGTTVGEALEREVAADKARLEEVTGRTPRFFAYPFGGSANVSAAAVDALRAADYASAFTIVPAFWRRDDDPYLVGRDSLSVEAGERLWRSWLGGGYDWPCRLRHRRRLAALRRHA